MALPLSTVKNTFVHYDKYADEKHAMMKRRSCSAPPSVAFAHNLTNVKIDLGKNAFYDIENCSTAASDDYCPVVSQSEQAQPRPYQHALDAEGITQYQCRTKSSKKQKRNNDKKKRVKPDAILSSLKNALKSLRGVRNVKIVEGSAESTTTLQVQLLPITSEPKASFCSRVVDIAKCAFLEACAASQNVIILDYNQCPFKELPSAAGFSVGLAFPYAGGQQSCMCGEIYHKIQVVLV